MRRELYVACLLAAGCSSAATGASVDDTKPVVDSYSPLTGGYGTSISVHGRNVLRPEVGVVSTSPDGERVELVATPNVAAIPESGPIAADAPLFFRFAFPAEGAMTLVAPSGEIPIGSFTPSWSPGRPQRLSGERVLGAAALGEDTAVVVDGPGGVGFMIFGVAGAAPRFLAASPALGAPDSRAQVRAQGTTVQALVSMASGLALVTYDGASVTSAKYTDLGGSPLGVGVDADGFVIPVRDASGRIARMRGVPPKATIDGAPVDAPSSKTYEAYGVAPDGTVVYAFGQHGGDVFDDKADFEMQGLAPKAAAFSPPTQIAFIDDDVKSLGIDVKSGLLAISYCAVDSEPLTPPRDVCGTATTADGKAMLPIDKDTAITAAASAAGAILATSCNADDSVVVRTFAPGSPPGDGEATLYPCANDAVRVRAIAPSAPDGPRLVVESQGKLWVARRR